MNSAAHVWVDGSDVPARGSDRERRAQGRPDPVPVGISYPASPVPTGMSYPTPEAPV